MIFVGIGTTADNIFSSLDTGDGDKWLKDSSSFFCYGPLVCCEVQGLISLFGNVDQIGLLKWARSAHKGSSIKYVKFQRVGTS